MWNQFVQVWKSRDLRRRILVTFALLLFIRVISHIPLPGIDRAQLAQFLQQSENQVFGVLSVFTGGSLSNLSIDLMGVGPYITASIVVQLLTKVVPAWEEMSKEGNSGREKLNQYSRYLTVPLGFIQGYGTIALLKSQNVLPAITSSELFLILLTITATTLFVMWLGELISENGLGNGVSLIIALGIVSSLPQRFANIITALQGGNITPIIVIGAVAILIVAVIVLVNEAQRNVPVTYPRRAATPTTGQAVDSYLPIKVNTAGVIPIIFALSFLTFPAIIARFLSTAKSENIVNFASGLSRFFNNGTYYAIMYFVLVVVFTFFYTYIVFQPEQISENLQKQGGFIPGIRPGSETIKFLKYTITRLTVMGSLFLGLIAVLPLLLQKSLNMPNLIIGGTSVLIVVSVVIETSRQLSGQMSMRRYDTI